MTVEKLIKLMKWKELPYYVHPLETLIKKGFNHFEPLEFENFIQTLFKSFGFDCELTPLTSDGGLDICFEDEKGQVIIQCKKYNSDNRVNVGEVREFFGVMNHYNVAYGYFITTSDFTDSAKSFSQEHPNLILISHKALERFFRLSILASEGKL